MFQGFFDESGIHAGAKVLSLSGYIAPEKEWERFIPRWQAVLDKYGISVFHAVECNSCNGEFSKFKEDREGRNQFVAELLSTLDRRRIIPVMSALMVDDYDEGIRAAMVGQAKHPFYALFQSVMSHIAFQMRELHYDNEVVPLVFDRQAEFSKHALNIFNEWMAQDWEHAHFFSGLTFESKDAQVPLQAADALAFDAAKEVERERLRPDRRVRPSFTVLSHGIRPLVWDRAMMEQYAARFGERPNVF